MSTGDDAGEVTAYPLNTLVWLKQPDYPWWPGVVIDPASSGLDVPPGRDVCVLCLPADGATVAFASATDDEELRRFRGPVEDATLIEDGRAHTECAAAVEEALKLFSSDASGSAVAAQDDTAPPDTAPIAAPAQQATDASAPSTVKAQSEADEVRGAADEAQSHRHRHHDRHRSRHERHKRHGSSHRRSHTKRHRSETNAAAATAANDDDDDDENDSSAHRTKRRTAIVGSKGHVRRKHVRRASDEKASDAEDDDSSDASSEERQSGRRAAARRAREMRQSRLDEYEFEAARAPAPQSRVEDDAEYYYRKCREQRRSVTDDELLRCRDALHELIGLCMRTSFFEENEERLLELLRQLSVYDVTLEQLCTTRIGTVVGQLLRRAFPYRVSQLAKAILSYWFQHLPRAMQQHFAADTELDRCSIDTTAGTRSEDEHQALGPVGVHVFESFTDEEIDDAPGTTNVMELCKELETALRERNDGGDTCITVLAELSDAANGPLRRALLEGKVTVEDVVNNASDLHRLLRGFNRHGLRNIATGFDAATAGGVVNSPTSPSSPGFGESEGGFSPTGRSTLGNLTTLYTCPNCGAKEAFRTVYTVQAHDNYPEILRCKRCDTTWNIADQ